MRTLISKKFGKRVKTNKSINAWKIGKIWREGYQIWYFATNEYSNVMRSARDMFQPAYEFLVSKRRCCEVWKTSKNTGEQNKVACLHVISLKHVAGLRNFVTCCQVELS